MKRILMIALAVLVFMPAHAGIQIAYNYFDIKNAQLNLKVYSDSLFGARGDGLRMGGTVSTLDFNTSFTSYNPAVLAFEKTPYAAFSGIPFEFASSSVAGFVLNTNFGDGFSAALRGFIDGEIQKTSPGISSSIEVYSLYGAQANGLSGMEGVLPFAAGNASIAVAREERFGLEMNLNAEEAKINMDVTDPSVGGFAMNMTITAGMVADLRIKSLVTSVGIGRKIFDQWGIGAVLEYIDTTMSVAANAGAQAVMQDQTPSSPTYGQSFELNTNESNSLEQYLRGDINAAAWALRVGTSFHAPGDQAEVAIEFSIQPKFKFDGDMAGVTHTLPSDSAAILAAYAAGTPVSVSKAVSAGDYDINMKLPSYFRATLAWKPGPMVLAFNYTYGFDEMSLTVDGADSLISYDLHMQHQFRLGLNFEYFQMGAGIMLVHENSIMENKINNSGYNAYSENIVPVASLGWVIPIGTNIKTEWELAAFPFPAGKAALVVNY